MLNGRIGLGDRLQPGGNAFNQIDGCDSYVYDYDVLVNE